MRVFLKRIGHLGPAAYTMLRGTLLIAFALNLSSLILHLGAGWPGMNTYQLRAAADMVYEMAPGLLLIGVIIAAVAEATLEKSPE